MSQGGQANITGRVLENIVTNVLTSKGFVVVKYSDWIKNKEKYGNELLLRNVPYTTIYKHKGKSEFLLISKKYDMRIRIECKWQQKAGSVDEKLPYLYLNTIEAMPETEIIIIIDGGGYKQGAVNWLKDAVKQKKYMTNKSNKVIHVMSISDFITWANTTFK